MASNANDVSSEVCWFRTSSSVQTSYHSGAVYKNSSFLAQKSKEKVKCLEIVRSLSSYKAGPKRTGKAVSVADVVGTISEQPFQPSRVKRMPFQSSRERRKPSKQRWCPSDQELVDVVVAVAETVSIYTNLEGV